MEPIEFRFFLSSLGTLLLCAAVIGSTGCASNLRHPSAQAYGDFPKTVTNAAPPLPEPPGDPPLNQTQPSAQVLAFGDIPGAVANTTTPPPPPEPQTAPPESQETIKDPLEPVNEKSFNVNQGLDEHAFRPIVMVWIKITTPAARKCISRFFDNTGVVPRFTNALLQLRFKWAGTELARFGVNSTLGIGGLFDPADKWFGLKEHDNSFDMTLARYGIGRGWYLMPPVGEPFDVRKAIGSIVDSLMNPMNYLVPGSAIIFTRLAHGVEALNSRAESQDVIDDLHRFSIDEYGAVQDAFTQNQKKKEDAARNAESP
jgi:phospholipid-binding lipoprotein MlaA